MAQSGYTPVLLYASSTTGHTPLATALTNSANGSEIAINILDGILFYKDNAGTVQTIASKNAAAGIFSTPVAISSGGTGQSTAAAAFNALSPITSVGDLILGNGVNSATRLAIGLNGQVLASNGTTASWQTATGTGTVTSVNASGGTTGLTFSGGPITAAGTLTLAGTLAIANGGTGQTTASAAFNALSPVTSTGDLILGNGVNSSTRLPIGTNTYILTSNGTTAVWAAPPSSMVYPGAGIANSTGTAWGTSYSTTGSGTVVALATGAALTTPALSAATYSTTPALVAGTNAQGQGAITSDFTVITTTTANPSGVTLPSATTGLYVVVVNKGTNPINIYPASGGFIDAGAVNTSITLAVGQWIEFNASSGTQWYSTLNASINTTALVGTVSNAQLANSHLTIGSTAVSLGGTVTTFAGVTLTSPTFTTPALGTPASGTLTNCTFPTLNQNTTGSAGSVVNALTIGTGLSGTSYNGSAAVTVALSNTAVTAASYGSASVVPTFTVNAQGQLTLAANATISIPSSAINTAIPNSGLSNSAITINGSAISLGGSVSVGTVTSLTSTTLSIAGTSAVPTVNLTSGIVTAGTTGSATLIPVVTVDTYGRVTAVTTAANPQGTVTSVSGTGTVNGITLTGTVTAAGSLTLGGTLGSIANSQLTNSTISGISLGSNLATLTIGTGLSGTSYNGSAAVTITNTGVTSVAAGTGISLSGSTGAVTITNSAPDQTVSLTGGTGISTSGTYPNFTITNTGASSLVATVYGVGAYSYMQISGSARSASATVAGSSCNAISHISNQSNAFAPNWYQQGTQSGTWQCMTATTGGNTYSIVLMQRIS